MDDVSMEIIERQLKHFDVADPEHGICLRKMCYK